MTIMLTFSMISSSLLLTHSFIRTFRENKDKKSPSWYTKNVLTLKNKKSKAYKRYVSSGIIADFSSYTNLKRQLLLCLKQSYKKYILNTAYDL